MNAKSSIIKFAKSIGVDYIGFSDTHFSSDFVNNLRRSREENRLSSFEESNELERVNIDSLMERPRTFISIGIGYKVNEVSTIKPYFSKYTLGIDYHRIINEKLKLISDYIKEEFDGECLQFCDTSKLHDKEIAIKCGIGFQGKNTNIITRNHGSFVFLGEILTNIYLESDEIQDNKCGDCRRCIDACPVNAIGEKGLDGKKCLSYITQKKVLDDGDENSLSKRIFGCDTCQDVCPYNKNIELSNTPEFEPMEYLVNIDYNEILSISNKEFKEKYTRHSLGWRGKFIIQRNVIIALGNLKERKYIPLLESKLEDDKLGVYARNALDKIKQYKGEF
ncbi:MAG: tRNA epoxyqueuosine(34) reductase QueG [Clostridium sp.]|uniref:tRNA epoxyqueuosine(34) reductase QueG n=1 Tax=Clostridium sp. TaxID=1506 RepID=UPI002FC9EFDB